MSDLTTTREALMAEAIGDLGRLLGRLEGLSARMNGHDPYAYLKDVLTRLPTHKASRIDELLPNRWKPGAS